MAAVWKNGKKGPEKETCPELTPVREAKPLKRAGRADSDAHAKEIERDFLPSRQGDKRRVRWWADLFVLALVALLVIGGVLGYRALKHRAVEAPASEVQVEYQVLLYDLSEDTDTASLVGKAFRLSQQQEGQSLGTVTAVEWDQTVPHVLCVTVRTPAQYQEGNGYQVDYLRLMAGFTPANATFELGEVSAKGMIVSLTAG